MSYKCGWNYFCNVQEELSEPCTVIVSDRSLKNTLTDYDTNIVCVNLFSHLFGMSVKLAPFFFSDKEYQLVVIQTPNCDWFCFNDCKGHRAADFFSLTKAKLTFSAFYQKTFIKLEYRLNAFPFFVEGKLMSCSINQNIPFWNKLLIKNWLFFSLVLQ